MGYSFADSAVPTAPHLLDRAEGNPRGKHPRQVNQGLTNRIDLMPMDQAGQGEQGRGKKKNDGNAGGSFPLLGFALGKHTDAHDVDKKSQPPKPGLRRKLLEFTGCRGGKPKKKAAPTHQDESSLPRFVQVIVGQNGSQEQKRPKVGAIGPEGEQQATGSQFNETKRPNRALAYASRGQWAVGVVPAVELFVECVVERAPPRVNEAASEKEKEKAIQIDEFEIAPSRHSPKSGGGNRIHSTSGQAIRPNGRQIGRPGQGENLIRKVGFQRVETILGG